MTFRWHCSLVEIEVEIVIVFYNDRLNLMRLSTDSRLTNTGWRSFRQIATLLVDRLADHLEILQRRCIIRLCLLQQAFELLNSIFLSVELILTDLLLFEVGTWFDDTGFEFLFEMLYLQKIELCMSSHVRKVRGEIKKMKFLHTFDSASWNTRVFSWWSAPDSAFCFSASITCWARFDNENMFSHSIKVFNYSNSKICWDVFISLFAQHFVAWATCVCTKWCIEIQPNRRLIDASERNMLTVFFSAMKFPVVHVNVYSICIFLFFSVFYKFSHRVNTERFPTAIQQSLTVSKCLKSISKHTFKVAWFSISCHALSNCHSWELDMNLCSAKATVSFAAAWISECWKGDEKNIIIRYKMNENKFSSYDIVRPMKRFKVALARSASNNKPREATHRLLVQTFLPPSGTRFVQRALSPQLHGRDGTFRCMCQVSWPRLLIVALTR